MSHNTFQGSNQAKFWGNTQCVFCGPHSEVHYLQINNGGYCSEHQHEHKWNRFFLISGRLRVIIYREDGQDVTTLKAGQYTDVPPGVYHKFEAEEESTCLEVYWTDNLNPADIVRRTTGGINNEKDNNNSSTTKQPKTSVEIAADSEWEEYSRTCMGEPYREFPLVYSH